MKIPNASRYANQNSRNIKGKVHIGNAYNLTQGRGNCSSRENLCTNAILEFKNLCVYILVFIIIWFIFF